MHRGAVQGGLPGVERNARHAWSMQSNEEGIHTLTRGVARYARSTPGPWLSSLHRSAVP